MVNPNPKLLPDDLLEEVEEALTMCETPISLDGIKQKIDEIKRHQTILECSAIPDDFFSEFKQRPFSIRETQERLKQILKDQKWLRGRDGLKLPLPEDCKKNLRDRVRETQDFLNKISKKLPKKQLDRLRRLLKEFLEEVDKGESNCKLLEWLSGRFCKNLKALRLVGLLTLGPAIDASITAYGHLWHDVESICSKIEHYHNDNDDSSEREKNPNEQIQSAISALKITHNVKDGHQPPDDSSQSPSL